MYEKLQNVQIPNFDVKNQLPRWIHDQAMLAARFGEQAREAIQTNEDLQKRQQFIREGIELCLGAMPAVDTTLNPVITGTLQGNGFRVEKLIFEPRPKVYAAAHVYVPEGLTKKAGAVLVLCGHREPAKHHEEYQTVCQYLVHAGLIVLALDPVGQGERYSYYDRETKSAPMTSVIEHENVGRQMLPLGDNLAKYMLHDAVRAIDYLAARPEVDPNRIGVTGHSGGGTQTSLVMMYDQRIAAAAPAGFIMNRPYFLLTGKTADAEQKWPGFSALGLDHEDILLAMAPRAVRVLATTYDSVPIEAPRHNVAVNKRFWEMLGRGDCVDIFEDETVHKYSVPLVKGAAAFFSKHLNGKEVTFEQDDLVQLFTNEEMTCTRTGQVIGDYEDAKNIHQETVEKLEELEQERAKLPPEALKKQALEWLRDTVYRNRKPVDMNPRISGGGEADGMWVMRAAYWSQRELMNHVQMFYDPQHHGEKRPVTIAVWEGGTTRLEEHADWLKQTTASGRIAMVLNPTGIGPLLPFMNNPADNPYKKFGVLDRYTDELMLLGDSMAAVRIYDVLRAVELTSWLKNTGPEDVELYGHGRYAVYAELAALLSPKVRQLQLETEMNSIGEWIRNPFYENNDSLSFIIPGMLKYFDLPDAMQWLDESGRLRK